MARNRPRSKRTEVKNRVAEELKRAGIIRKIVTNWDLVRKNAIYSNPSTVNTIEARMREGQSLLSLEPVYENFEREENGRTTRRQRLLYYTMPIY
jgi:hypothetical protein